MTRDCLFENDVPFGTHSDGVRVFWWSSDASCFVQSSGVLVAAHRLQGSYPSPESNTGECKDEAFTPYRD